MNIPSLYGSRAFYDSTSALNAFCSPCTRGVASTLRSCDLGSTLASAGLGSNLASAGLGANPAFGNIGYANRISGTGDWTEWLGNAVGNVIDRAAPILNQAFEAFLGQGKMTVLKAAGYTFLGPVTTVINGVEIPGIKAQKKDGSFVIVLKDGNEVPFTSQVAAQTRTVDVKTGLTSGQTTGLIVGGVALVALFLFMSKRR